MQEQEVSLRGVKNGKIFVFCGFEPQNILYLWGFAGIKLLFSMTEYTIILT